MTGRVVPNFGGGITWSYHEKDLKETVRISWDTVRQRQEGLPPSLFGPWFDAGVLALPRNWTLVCPTKD